MRRLAALLALACLLPLAQTVVQGADPAPRLVGVMPARVGEQLVCHLKTLGLPGPKQLQSMRSGLVSAVELNLVLVDEDDQVLEGQSLSLRMGFDLWEEVFSVQEDGRERRFHTLADLQDYLSDLRDLPVAPASLVGPTDRYRLRVGLVIHAIAPDERRRVEDVIVGEQRPRREGLDQQEASVSLGRLIRFFYKGGGDDQEGQELASGWFTGKDLPDETH